MEPEVSRPESRAISSRKKRDYDIDESSLADYETDYGQEIYPEMGYPSTTDDLWNEDSRQSLMEPLYSPAESDRADRYQRPLGSISGKRRGSESREHEVEFTATRRPEYKPRKQVKIDETEESDFEDENEVIEQLQQMDTEQILEFAKTLEPRKREKIIKLLQSMDMNEREELPAPEPKPKRYINEYGFPSEYIPPDYIQQLYDSIPAHKFEEAKRKVKHNKKYLEFLEKFTPAEQTPQPTTARWPRQGPQQTAQKTQPQPQPRPTPQQNIQPNFSAQSAFTPQPNVAGQSTKTTPSKSKKKKKKEKATAPTGQNVKPQQQTQPKFQPQSQFQAQPQFQVSSQSQSQNNNYGRQNVISHNPFEQDNTDFTLGYNNPMQNNNAPQTGQENDQTFIASLLSRLSQDRLTELLNSGDIEIGQNNNITLSRSLYLELVSTVEQRRDPSPQRISNIRPNPAVLETNAILVEDEQTVTFQTSTNNFNNNANNNINSANNSANNSTNNSANKNNNINNNNNNNNNGNPNPNSTPKATNSPIQRNETPQPENEQEDLNTLTSSLMGFTTQNQI